MLHHAQAGCRQIIQAASPGWAGLFPLEAITCRQIFRVESIEAVATGRVFNDRELLEAGQLTVDLIAGRLAQGTHAGAKDLVRRFQSELMTMFFSYTGWEKSILGYFAEYDGKARRDEVLAAVENWEIAPERNVEIPGTEQRWNEEISTILELISALRTGTPLFMVEPPEDIGISPCKIYVYKDPAQIPEAYYRRLGLEKPGDLIARSGIG